MSDTEPKVGDTSDLKFDPSGTHQFEIIKRLKRIGIASYHREKKSIEETGFVWPYHDQENGMAAAEAIIWLENHYQALLLPIPCSERMPDTSRKVLCYFKGLDWMVGHRADGAWSLYDGDGKQGLKVDDIHITHWREMPPAP